MRPDAHTDDAQRRAGWVATITALVVVAGFIAGKAARDAILLSSFSIKALPIFITLSALISFPVILIARLVTMEIEHQRNTHQP